MKKGKRAAKSISFKSTDGKQIVLRLTNNEAYCSIDGGDAHTVKEVRFMPKQQKLYFPGSKLQGVKLSDKEQLDKLQSELSSHGIENDISVNCDNRNQPVSVTIGDHVKAEKHSESKVYRVVNEMKAWNRYELEDCALGDLTWRDAKALTICPNSRLAIAWDPLMSDHGIDHDDILEAPERPTRTTHLWDHLLASNVLDSCFVLQTTQQSFPTDEDFNERLRYLKECICSIHTESHYEKVLAGDTSCVKDETNSAETQMTKGTPKACLTAVDICLRVTDEVMEGNAPSGLAVIRPPGHHAGADYAMGFCYFNNVAITAASLLKRPSVNKVAILDWDVHHGNGIQDAFYSSPDILYISLHVYANGKFYPGTGRLQETGNGTGVGHNINIAWSEVGAADVDYDFAFSTVVVPVLRQFSPDVLMISSGFDAADGDPLGQCKVTPAGFARMTEHLLTIPNCKTIAALEGGYDLNCLGECTTSVIKMMQKHAIIPPKPTIPSLSMDLLSNSSSLWGSVRPSSVYNLYDVVTILQKHWSCLDGTLEFLKEAATDIRGKETAKALRRRFEGIT
eukprot:TRINITY_DN11927_c0_g1_i1.p1 TRINITY_DN11927_c0_g1~~TRINITY_DN11927_c0_g1_i1.p1  ORF type:complete len:566 (+),score=107.39 TRINITY_DN11927_c0_g1_i1:52-1749(+)